MVDFSSEKYSVTRTPGTSREIYSEDADDGTRTRNPSVINRVLYSPFHGCLQSFVTIGSCNHLMRIISRYVGSTKESEIS